MGDDIFYGKSTAELKKDIDVLVAADTRSLPPKAKTFAAIAKLQGFDMLPDVGDIDEIDEQVAAGCVHLNRGIAGTKSATAAIYAKDLLFGSMYPGTLSAYGNGIYFAAPGEKQESVHGFPHLSVLAKMYAAPPDPHVGPGIIVRAAIKPTAKTADCQELRVFFRENKSRAQHAGITDIGAFAASLGIEAYYLDDCYDHTDERVWVVVNRGALVFQKIALQVPYKPGI